MQFFSIALLFALVLVTVLASVVVARLMQYRESKFLNAPKDGEDRVDLSRYAVMSRLIDPEEAAFLAQQPGVTASQVRDFRRARRQIFRTYLRELSADFQTLHAEARQIVAASPHNNSELVETLMKQQARFWLAVARIEAELMLDSLGWSHVNPGRLLEAVEAMHAAVARATEMPGPMPIA